MASKIVSAKTISIQEVGLGYPANGTTLIAGKISNITITPIIGNSASITSSSYSSGITTVNYRIYGASANSTVTATISWDISVKYLKVNNHIVNKINDNTIKMFNDENIIKPKQSS